MAKRKFQIGDKVRVKPDLKVNDLKFGFVFTEAQAQLKGHTLTIDDWNRLSETYLFKETGIDMPAYFLEKVDSAPAQLAPKFKVGDKVKFKQDLIVGAKYGKITYFKYMDSLKGRIWNIVGIRNKLCYLSYYPSIINDAIAYTVSPEMIEPYVEEQPKCCEGKVVNCTEPTSIKKELELPKEAFEVTGSKEPSSLIARRKNRKIYYTVDKPIC